MPLSARRAPEVATFRSGLSDPGPAVAAEAGAVAEDALEEGLDVIALELGLERAEELAVALLFEQAAQAGVALGQIGGPGEGGHGLGV